MLGSPGSPYGGWVGRRMTTLRPACSIPSVEHVSLYHMLGRVQEWVFGLSTDINDVSSAALLLVIVTVMPLIVLLSASSPRCAFELPYDPARERYQTVRHGHRSE